jgi:ribonuclease HIII
MTSSADLDLLCQQFWRSGDAQERRTTVFQLMAAVCDHLPDEPVTAGRCATILATADLPGGWEERLEPFRQRLGDLIKRHRQIDALGDDNTEPEAVFDLLGDEINESLDLKAFDFAALRRVRLGKANRAAAADAFLAEFGWDSLNPMAAQELRTAIGHLTTRATRYQSTAMFADGKGAGVALGVQVTPMTTGLVNLYSEADPEMRQQAESVLTTALEAAGADVGVEWPVTFGGSSIGLALWLATNSQTRLRPDPLLAVTGRIDASRSVCAVSGVREKVRAAALSGYRRILVPRDNLEEARAALEDDLDLVIRGVAHLDDVLGVLADAGTGTALRMDGALAIIRRALPLYGLDLVDEPPISNGRRITVADAGGTAQVDVYSGRRATMKASGRGSALVSLQRLLDERLPQAQVVPREGWTVVVKAPDRRASFLHALRGAGGEELATTSTYEDFRYRMIQGASSALAIGYTTGKIYVAPGQAPAHDRVTGLLATAVEGLGGVPPRPTQPKTPPTPAAAGRTTVTPADQLVPHIGTDEAGKGDYFGPLVCAACYLDPDVAALLRELGVRDSKALSDKNIRALAEQIRERLPGRFSVVTLRPVRYNSLYAELKAEGKNLNSLVAWGHARGIKDLFDHGIWAEYAVIDKFADEHYLHERLGRDTRRGLMRLEHRTKAESDVAVAAASILARNAFVEWFDSAQKAAGMILPKGAGPQVIEAARELVRLRGVEALGEYAKLSFKTTQAVIGGGA